MLLTANADGSLRNQKIATKAQGLKACLPVGRVHKGLKNPCELPVSSCIRGKKFCQLCNSQIGAHY